MLLWWIFHHPLRQYDPATCHCYVYLSFPASVNTWTRETMGQNRLGCLALIHTHYIYSVDLDKVVDIFAKKRCKKNGSKVFADVTLTFYCMYFWTVLIELYIICFVFAKLFAQRVISISWSSDKARFQYFCHPNYAIMCFHAVYTNASKFHI